MDQAIRALAAAAAIAVAGNGIGLITDGDAMARLMGLPLVEETGLANQIANLGFFLFIGSAMAVTGAWTRSPVFFYCAAALIGCVLDFRLFASLA